MAESNFEEKTEAPTPKKRADTRKKGEVAKSRELPSVAVLVAGLASLAVFGSFMYSQIQKAMGNVLAAIPSSAKAAGDLPELVSDMTAQFALMMAPQLAAVFLAALLSNIMQVGFMASGELIKPKLSKLDPLKGLGRLFSIQSVMELFKSVLKLVIVGVVAYFAIKSEMERVGMLADMELGAMVAYILLTTFKISLKCALAMIVLVAADYAFQKWQFEKRNKMTKKEIKDEFKNTEGDPIVKSRIKSIQMEMARKRMMQDVPKADVVITNPTHYAVALKYDGLSMNAPAVLAKGAGEIALKIKEIAAQHQIPVVENKTLARSLFALAEIGREIPAGSYQAVAEVLAVVYKLKQGNPVH